MSSSLKTRLIGIIPVIDGTAVQSVNFDTYLPIGDPSLVVENLNRHDIDELVILDIGIYKGFKETDLKVFEACAQKSLVPITIGGGINKLSKIKKMFRYYADKVALNTSLFETPELVINSSIRFGSQAIVGSLDVKYDSRLKKFMVYSKGGLESTNLELNEGISLCEDLGCGEILINSIRDDGKKCGYNKKILQSIHSTKNLPILIAGGVGSFKHLAIDKKLHTAGLCVGNYFNFAEHQVLLSKRYLKDLGYKIRMGIDIHSNTKLSVRMNSQLPPKELS